MKKISMLLLCALILNMFTAFASNSMIYIYVSPIGDDKNDGKVGNPFKTINKALKYIDTLPGTEDITIYLYSGVYRERVIIDKSYGRKVNFKNIQGETPIIDGSQLLGGFTQYNGNIYKINVSGISGTSVFDNGAPMTLARYPNSGYLAGDASSPISYNEFCYKSGEMPNLSNSLNLKVSLWPSGPNGVWNYFNTEHTITNIDLLTRKITISPDAVYQLGTGTRYYLINSLELLDSPGEWYLDSSTKDLYCYPSSGSFENISISGNNPLITIEGSNNITFDGITLQGGGYNAVYLMNSNNISILNCHIRNVDGNAIYMAPQGNNNTFYGNKIENIGFCGIQLQGQNKHYTNPSIKGNIIKNNEISKVGTKIGHGVAISIINSAENIISHNKIFDIPRHGIAFGGSSPETLINQSPIDGQIVTTENVRDYYTTRDNIIEYNDISDVIKDSQDAGAINGWMTGSNNVIRQNRVYNVNIPFSFGFGGIYLDAGTDDTLVEKNIIYDLQKSGINTNGMESAVLINGINNKVQNNIIANSNLSKGFITNTDMTKISSELNKPKMSNKNIEYERNIYFNSGSSIYYFTNFYEQMIEKSDDNFYYNNDNSNFTILMHPPSPHYQVSYSDYWKTLYGSKYDSHSSLDAPKFINAEQNDFRFAYDSPVYSKGIVDIDFLNIGLLSDFKYSDSGSSLKDVYLRKKGTQFAGGSIRADKNGKIPLEVLVKNEKGHFTSFDTVDFTSSNENVAVVDSKGVITTRQPGVTTISAEVMRNNVAKTSIIQVVVEDKESQKVYLEQPTLTDENSISLINPIGNSLKMLKAQIHAVAQTDKEIILIIAKYDIGNRLISISYTKVKANGGEEISLGVAKDEGEILKAFVWDNLSGIKPLKFLQ